MHDPPTSAPSSLRDPFIADHLRLEDLLGRACETLEAAAYDQLVGVWREFREALARHMHAEESTVIPALALAQPRRVRAIFEEHGYIRRRCAELTAGIDRATVRPEAVRTFAAELRAHAAHEANELYRWAEGGLDSSAHARAIASLNDPERLPAT